VFTKIIKKAKAMGYKAKEGLPVCVICEASGEWSKLGKREYPAAQIGSAVIYSDDPDGHCRAYIVIGGSAKEVRAIKKLISEEFFR
jgi:hypothetical protein